MKDEEAIYKANNLKNIFNIFEEESLRKILYSSRKSLILLSFLLTHHACSGPSKGQDTAEDHPHFKDVSAFRRTWATGAPGGIRGSEHVFRFLPKKELEPEFTKVLIENEEREPDISSEQDTIVLKVRKSGTMTPDGKVKEEKGTTKKAVVHYSLNGEDHEFRVEKIPRKKTNSFNQ